MKGFFFTIYLIILMVYFFWYFLAEDGDLFKVGLEAILWPLIAIPHVVNIIKKVYCAVTQR